MDAHRRRLALLLARRDLRDVARRQLAVLQQGVRLVAHRDVDAEAAVELEHLVRGQGGVRVDQHARVGVVDRGARVLRVRPPREADGVRGDVLEGVVPHLERGRDDRRHQRTPACDGLLAVDGARDLLVHDGAQPVDHKVEA